MSAHPKPLQRQLPRVSGRRLDPHWRGSKTEQLAVEAMYLRALVVIEEQRERNRELERLIASRSLPPMSGG